MSHLTWGDLNSDSLQEQFMLLTAEPSLVPLLTVFIVKHFYTVRETVRPVKAEHPNPEIRNQRCSKIWRFLDPIWHSKQKIPDVELWMHRIIKKNKNFFRLCGMYIVFMKHIWILCWVLVQDISLCTCRVSKIASPRFLLSQLFQIETLTSLVHVHTHHLDLTVVNILPYACSIYFVFEL